MEGVRREIPSVDELFAPHALIVEVRGTHVIPSRPSVGTPGKFISTALLLTIGLISGLFIHDASAGAPAYVEGFTGNTDAILRRPARVGVCTTDARPL